MNWLKSIFGIRIQFRQIKWEQVHACATCNCELIDQERLYSGGVCPFCGVASVGTIVDTIKFSREKFR